MKTAIYITGQPRMIKFCLPYFKQMFEHLDPDYFVYNWDESEGKYTGVHNNAKKIKPDEVKQIYRSVLKDKLIDIQVKPNTIIQKYKKTINELIDILYEDTGYKIRGENFFPHALNYVSQHHCTDLCNKMQKSHKKKYDLIIRTRSDIVFEHFYKRPQVEEQIKNSLPKFIELTNIYNEKKIPFLSCKSPVMNGGVLRTDDMFFIGNQYGVDKIHDGICSTWILNLFQHCLGDFTGYRTNHLDIPIDQHYIFYTNTHFRKPTGLVCGPDFDPKRSFETYGNTEFLHVMGHPYTSLYGHCEICRHTVVEEDTYTDVCIKNRAFMDKIEEDKKIQDLELRLEKIKSDAGNVIL